VVRRVDLVDDLALDVRVEDLDLKAQFGSKAADALVVFGEQHRSEDLQLHLAAHVHAGAVNDQNLGHDASPCAERGPLTAMLAGYSTILNGWLKVPVLAPVTSRSLYSIT